MSRALPRSFYERPTLEVARELIGNVLVHRTADGTASGVIVEAEAYIGETDPACHAAPGPTRRNAPLYGPPGIAYVYLNYGMHYLVNAVTEAEGRPAAVLLRALEPLEALELMRARRRGVLASVRTPRGPKPDPAGRKSATETTVPDAALCRGPGNLARALGIDLAQNGSDLCGSALVIEDRGLARREIVWSPRIGIRVGTEQWWRVFVKGHPSVSGPRVLHDAASAHPLTFETERGKTGSG